MNAQHEQLLEGISRKVSDLLMAAAAQPGPLDSGAPELLQFCLILESCLRYGAEASVIINVTPTCFFFSLPTFPQTSSRTIADLDLCAVSFSHFPPSKRYGLVSGVFSKKSYYEWFSKSHKVLFLPSSPPPFLPSG